MTDTQQSTEPQRESVLDRWKAQRQARGTTTIPHQSLEGLLPLSFAQERMWFLQQMMPESSSYHLPMAFRLKGAINRDILQQSVMLLIERHTILRTIFREIHGVPQQEILPSMPVTVTLKVVQDVPAEDREAALQHEIKADYHQRFNLETGPLWRITLFQLNDDDHVLLLNIHHIITDGWSNGILIRELNQVYQALIQGRSAQLPPLEYQFAELAAWENQRFAEPSNQDLDYWKQVLGNYATVVQLPTDYLRPTTPSTEGAVYDFQLPHDVATALKHFCKHEQVTFGITMLAALKTLLLRYTGFSDLAIGMPVFGRQRREAEAIPGLFVNTMVVRTSLDNQPSFRTVVQRVHESLTGAYQHQTYPFEKLVNALQVKRDLSHTPLFQVMLALGAGSGEVIEWPEIACAVYPIERISANFDLTLEASERADGVFGTLLYRSDIFAPDTMERLSEHFIQLLTEALGNPDQAITTLNVLPEAERRLIFDKWNATTVEYPQPQTLPALLEAQFLRTPAAPALTFADQHLTYAQLHQRANQLAHYLQAHGVGPNTFVGIAMERSIELVVGLLGILKAGGAYVPIDPTYPVDRLRYMLEDAQVPILLTQARLQEHLPTTTATVIAVDTAWPTIAESPATPPTPTIQPTDRAYMIYTSGSTGQPKGAVNTHRGICNRLLWMQQEYGLAATDHVLQKTPISFDVSVWEFFWPLITGARLVLARPEGHKDPTYLRTIIQQEAITTLHFVPSMLQIFVEEPGIEACTSIRRVICSGEALSVDLQDRWFTRNNAELHNLYGPTEAAVDVTYWACQPNDHSRTSIPIGRPVANTQIYILDPLMQPVPIGVAGELHIGGVQVGAGYWNRPELTADRFVRDPWSAGRLYKTGDLARYRADGTIEYLGRIDQQVKLRGLRIELGEIEWALTQQPEVREAVVIMHQMAATDQRLVAYITPTDTDQPPTSALLRKALSTMLPDYMVPSLFICVERLPLSPSGKVDRAALPDPKLSHTSDDRNLTQPKSDLERTLVEIWQTILGTDHVGTEDNFFELGGHSLLLTQMRAVIRERLNVDISIVDAFRLPTLAALAQHIRGQGGSDRSTVTTQATLDRAALQRQAFQRKRTERR